MRTTINYYNSHLFNEIISQLFNVIEGIQQFLAHKWKYVYSIKCHNGSWLKGGSVGFLIESI